MLFLGVTVVDTVLDGTPKLFLVTLVLVTTLRVGATTGGGIPTVTVPTARHVCLGVDGGVSFPGVPGDASRTGSILVMPGRYHGDKLRCLAVPEISNTVAMGRVAEYDA